MWRYVYSNETTVLHALVIGIYKSVKMLILSAFLGVSQLEKVELWEWATI